MHLTRLSVLFVLLASFVLVACGDDGGSTAPDAQIFMDAPAPDAPTALVGLGQRCVPAMQGADCPANANGCLSFMPGATVGICTKLCVGPPPGTFTTNAQSQPGALNPAPATQNAMCPPIYTGTIGTAECNTLVNVMPAGALQPNTNYTFLAVCGIKCGAGNTCPAGLTCNAVAQACQP